MKGSISTQEEGSWDLRRGQGPEGIKKVEIFKAQVQECGEGEKLLCHGKEGGRLGVCQWQG